MREGYIPIPKNCINLETFNERGNVVVDYLRAEKEAQKCRKILTVEDQNQFLSEMAQFFIKHDYRISEVKNQPCHTQSEFRDLFSNILYRHSLDLFTGEVNRSGDGMALYPMKNMVANSEMTTLFRKQTAQNPDGSIVLSENVASAIKRGWSLLHHETDQSNTKANEREKIKEKSDSEFSFDF